MKGNRSRFGQRSRLGAGRVGAPSGNVTPLVDHIPQTGHAVSGDGIGDVVTIPFAAQQNVTTLTLFAKSSTDTAVYVGTENVATSGTIVANDTWQEVSIPINDSVADTLYLLSDGAGNNFAGEIAYARIASVGTWYLNEHAPGTISGLPAFDSSGNGNHGTYTGCTAVVGIEQGTNTPPQTALMDWNKLARSYKDVPNVKIGRLDAEIRLLRDVSPTKLAGRLLLYDSGTADRLFSLGPFTGSFTNETITLSRNSPSQRTAVLGTTISAGIHTLSMRWNGSFYDVYLDNVKQTVVSGGAGHVTQVTINTANSSLLGLDDAKHIISADFYDATNTLVHSYRPLESGATDLTGSTDLTESAGVIIPASTATISEDALGNPIEDPRRGLYNLTGFDGDRVEIPDSASLDVTTEATWGFWGNLYFTGGETRDIIARWDTANNKRVFLIHRNGVVDSGVDGKMRMAISDDGIATTYYVSFIASDEYAFWVPVFDGGTTLTLRKYVPGSGWSTVPLTVESGTLPASLFTTDIGVYLGDSQIGGRPTKIQLPPLRLYAEVMSEARQDQLRRATEPTYGQA